MRDLSVSLSEWLSGRSHGKDRIRQNENTAKPAGSLGLDTSRVQLFEFRQKILR